MAHKRYNRHTQTDRPAAYCVCSNRQLSLAIAAIRTNNYNLELATANRFVPACYSPVRRNGQALYAAIHVYRLRLITHKRIGRNVWNGGTAESDGDRK